MINSILIYLLIFIWLIVPFRQIGKKHFYFFLAGISADVTTIAIRTIFHSNSNLFIILFLFIAFISLIDKPIIIKGKIVIIISIAALIFIEIKSNYKLDYLLANLINLFIFLAFLADFIILYSVKRIFSLPLLFLILYELTIVTKYITLITGYKNAYPYFVVASIFEAFIGLFFCVFKEDNPRILFQLK